LKITCDPDHGLFFFVKPAAVHRQLIHQRSVH